MEQESIVARKKNSRKRKSDPKTWKRCEMRDKREKGEAYKNYKGIEIAQKLPCTGKRLCGIKCRLKCDIMFTDEARIRLFEEYYSLNYEQKNAYLFGVMEPFLVKQPSGRNRHRAKSFKYAFTVSGQRQQVCKEAVMSMLAVGRKKLDFIRNQISNGRLAPKKDDRGLHANRPHATPDEKIRFVHEHIKSFPSEMSHYSRHKNPNRLYLSPWLSINKMYDLYKEKCAIENVSPVSNGKYRNIFVNDFNFGFGSPKTDTCKICDVEKNDEHIKKFKRAFEQQKIDRGIGKNNEKTIYLTFDLQKTLPLPKISTGKAFYLRQVWLYNLGIHVITTQHPSGKGFFNVWTENEGGRGPEEVGSSLLVFLENIKEQDRTFDHLIAWSDSAAGQNKNFYIVCLWHYLINLGVFKKIEHKFPEVGHTFMDSDRDFAAVEKCIRKQQNIYTVDQYLQIMTEARKKTPFNITRIADKFVDIKELPRKLGLIDRKKSEKNEKFTFREVRWIQIEEFGITKYRYSFDEQEEWTIVDIRKNRMMERTQGNRNLVLETVDKSRAIAAKKYDNIQEQLPFIPENLRGFYNNLRRAED